MMMLDKAPSRWAASAKMFVVLMLVASLPAWTVGQNKPEQKSVPKPAKTFDLKDLKALIGDLELQLELAQPTAEPKPTPKRINVLELKDLKDLKGLLGDVELELRFAPDADPKSDKGLDAKISELTKQLEALKAAKAAADPLKKADTPKPETGVKERIILIGPDGKVIETKDADSKAAPRFELKILDGKTFELEFADPMAIPKVEPRKEAPQTKNPDVPLKVEIRDVDGKPQVIVIGPDGKEIKNIPVANPPVKLPTGVPPKSIALPVDPKLEEARKALEKQLEALREQQHKLSTVRPAATPASSSVKVINLTRATYALPKDKAEGLAAFLKAYIKASVLEIKVEGEGLTVTTTPEVQATVGGIVNLMQAKAPDQGGVRFEFKLAPPK